MSNTNITFCIGHLCCLLYGEQCTNAGSRQDEEVNCRGATREAALGYKCWVRYLKLTDG